MICGSAHTFSQARNAESWVEGGVGLVLMTCEKFTRHSTVECHIATFYFQARVPLPCNFSTTPRAWTRTCARPHAVTSVWTRPWRLTLPRQTDAAESLDVQQMHTVALFTSAFDKINRQNGTGNTKQNLPELSRMSALSVTDKLLYVDFSCHLLIFSSIIVLKWSICNKYL